MSYVLAVDPGKTTGFALWSALKPSEAVISQAENDVFLPYADRLMTAHGPELLIVCEAYIISPETLKKSRQTDPLEVIGVLRYLAFRHGSTFAPLQKAADAKTVVPNDRLRTLGWYERGADHGRDAARHLALWLLKNRILSPEIFLGD